MPLAPDGDKVLDGLVALLREQRPGEPVGYFGLSFGGHWAVRLALRGVVDAAVDLGGPTGAADEATDVLSLPYGMAAIVGNALGLTALPDATVWIVPGATHCAAERIRPVLAGSWGRLLRRFGAPVAVERILGLPSRRYALPQHRAHRGAPPGLSWR